MKKISIVLVSLLLAACTHNPPTQRPTNGTPEETPKNGKPDQISNNTEIPQYCLDFPENAELIFKPFSVSVPYEGAGYATLTGTVITQSQDFFGTFHDTVKFVIDKPQTEDHNLAFFEYFSDMTEEGNTVNTKTDSKLKFNIGAIEVSEFTSTAEVPESTQGKILAALNTDEKITLTLHVPKYEGRGAPANFSFACIIK